MNAACCTGRPLAEQQKTGAGPEGLSTFPAIPGRIGGRSSQVKSGKARRSFCEQKEPKKLHPLANPAAEPYLRRMITRSDIIWLGLSSGVAGGLIGGLLLGIGMNLVVQGMNVGWLLLMPAAPLSGLIGWILARKLARQI